jgi:hypothetical protein
MQTSGSLSIVTDLFISLFEGRMFSRCIVTDITSARGTLHCRKTRIPCGDQLMICGHFVSQLWPPMGLFFIPQVIYEYGEPRWNDIEGDSRRARRKYSSSATLSTTNITWTDPSANTGFSGERQVPNRLRYGNGRTVHLHPHFRPASVNF